MKKWGVLLAIGLLLSGCGSASPKSPAPIQIGEESVSREEFMLYFYEAQAYFEYNGGDTVWELDFDGQSAREVAKDRALASLKNVKLAGAHAGDFGVSLTEEEKSQAAEEGQSLYQSLTEEERAYIGLSEEEYSRVMTENSLYQKVYDTVTAGYEPTDGEWEAYYQENAESLREAATYIRISTILTADAATGEQVYQALLAGEDMARLSQEYEIDEDSKATVGQLEAYVGALLSDFGWDLTGAKAGDILPPFVEEEGTYVVRVEEVEAPAEDEVRAYAESSYTAYRRQELFEQAYQSWEEATTTRVDEDFWNGLRIFRDTEESVEK